MKMKIKIINIKNFKSIKDVTIPLGCYGNGENASNTTFLVGINECGKSAILEAVSLINAGFENVAYSNHCNLEAQEKDEYIDIYADLEIEDESFWKKQISEKLKLSVDFVEKIKIKKAQKNTWIGGISFGEQFDIEVNEDLPFFQYIVNKTQKTVNGKIQTTETIELLSDFNGTEEVTKENAKDFLEENQKLLTKEALESRISAILKLSLNQRMPQIQIWKPSPNYLINETVDLNQFKEDPNISIPLKNIFSIYGKNTNEEIKEAIERALSNQARCDELQKKMSNAVTKYINKIWKEHKIKIKISINSTNCEVYVEDKDKEFAYYSMAQRSDGFKQFISLILSLSAQNKSNSLKNNIILIDEPEVHLHPSGIKYMRDEILKIGKNNHIIVSTHSNYMVDTAVPERHWIVQKDKSETKISQMNENINFTDDKVLATAFGLNLFKELLPQNIIIVEGIDDKNILSHALRLLNKTFFCSIKDAGGATKMPGFAQLLKEENIKPFILFDADKEGKDNKKVILDNKKDFYSTSNVFTVKDVLSSLPNDSTVEDLLPINFVKDFFDAEMQVDFQLEEDKPIIHQLKNQSPILKSNKQKLDSLKVKLSNKFCADFKTKEELENMPRLKDFVKLICDKIENSHVE